MDNIDNDESLDFRDSDGVKRTVTDCNITRDKAGRLWLWSDKLQYNLAYKAKTKEDLLLIAIDSLLFTIQLRDERIKALQHVHDLAVNFANEIKPDNDDDRY